MLSGMLHTHGFRQIMKTYEVKKCRRVKLGNYQKLSFKVFPCPPKKILTQAVGLNQTALLAEQPALCVHVHVHRCVLRARTMELPLMLPPYYNNVKMHKDT